MKFEDILICPICKNPFKECSGSLKCTLGHSFDIASAGYVNLLKPGKMNNAKAGDSKEMIRARSAFFSSDTYLPIKNKICEIVSNYANGTVVDAGCGEGYYTSGIAERLGISRVIGFDISKFGCEHGAKFAKRMGLDNLLYSVASIFELPLESSCADIVINMFAPVASSEFLRILKPQGRLIVVSSGIQHLNGLKSALYDTTYENEEKFLDYEDFELTEVINLKYDTVINGTDTIYSLFTMTPYFHRTSQGDKEKLLRLDALPTTVEANFAIYKKIK